MNPTDNTSTPTPATPAPSSAPLSSVVAPAGGQQLRIEVLLEDVVKKRASDLHLQVGLPPMLRIDGSLTPVPGYDELDEPKVEALVYAIPDQEQQQILAKDTAFDFSFAFGNLGRFRVNALARKSDVKGKSVSVRVALGGSRLNKKK